MSAGSRRLISHWENSAFQVNSLARPALSENNSNSSGRFFPRISHYWEKTIMKALSENPVRAFQPITSKLLTQIAMKSVCIGLLSWGLLHAAPPWEEANPIKA